MGIQEMEYFKIQGYYNVLRNLCLCNTIVKSAAVCSVLKNVKVLVDSYFGVLCHDSVLPGGGWHPVEEHSAI